MVKHDRQLDGFVITPSEIQNEARSVNVDMTNTDAAASAVADAQVRAGWDNFLAAWKQFFGPIDDASTYNPFSPLWWSGTMDSIRDWRARLITWQKALQDAGASGVVVAQQSQNAGAPISAPSLDLIGNLKWIVIGGVALVLAVKLIPSRKG